MAIEKSWKNGRCMGCNAEIISLKITDTVTNIDHLVINLCPKCTEAETRILQSIQTAAAETATAIQTEAEAAVATAVPK